MYMQEICTELSQCSEYATDWTTVVTIPGGVGILTPRHRVQTDSGGHTAS
jgi:hypothetical protein